VAAPAEEAAAVPPAETPPQPVESPAPETGAVKEATTETPALQESRPEGAPGVEPTTELPVEAPAAIAPPPEVAEDVPPPDTNPITHVVKPGEYLSGIASKYDVKYQDIMKWNHLTEVKITPGDKLTIHVAKDFVLPATEALAATDAPAPAKTPAEPQPAPETAVAQPAPPTSAPVEAPSPQPPVEGMVDAPATESGEGPQAEAAPYLPEIKYSVQPRDALAKIADRYGVTVDELKEWNGRTSDDLKIGEVLIIHPRKMPTP
jgi:membrane-bound lytic murein transglycosylase D